MIRELRSYIHGLGRDVFEGLGWQSLFCQALTIRAEKVINKQPLNDASDGVISPAMMDVFSTLSGQLSAERRVLLRIADFLILYCALVIAVFYRTPVIAAPLDFALKLLDSDCPRRSEEFEVLFAAAGDAGRACDRGSDLWKKAARVVAQLADLDHGLVQRLEAGAAQSHRKVSQFCEDALHFRMGSAPLPAPLPFAEIFPRDDPQDVVEAKLRATLEAELEPRWGPCERNLVEVLEVAQWRSNSFNLCAQCIAKLIGPDWPMAFVTRVLVASMRALGGGAPAGAETGLGQLFARLDGLDPTAAMSIAEDAAASLRGAELRRLAEWATSMAALRPGDPTIDEVLQRVTGRIDGASPAVHQEPPARAESGAAAWDATESLARLSSPQTALAEAERIVGRGDPRLFASYPRWARRFLDVLWALRTRSPPPGMTTADYDRVVALADLVRSAPAQAFCGDGEYAPATLIAQAREACSRMERLREQTCGA